MITAQDGSIHLLRNTEHTWTREESLANVQHTLFLDLPIPEPKVHLKVSTGNLVSIYIDRLMTHIKQLRNLPYGLVTFARHFASGRYEEIELGSTNRDAFGLRKFIIVATGNGKLVALDSANGGNIVWSRFVPGAQVYGMWTLRESSAVRGQPPLIGVLLSIDGLYVFAQINGLDGTTVEKEGVEIVDFVKAFLAPGVMDSQGRRGVVVVTKKGDIKILPENKDLYNAAMKLGENFYYSVQEKDAVQGYFLDFMVRTISSC
jgi:hypothetical protein